MAHPLSFECFHCSFVFLFAPCIYEPRYEKTDFLHMRKERRRSAAAADQRLCFRYTDSTIPLLHKTKITSLYGFYGCTAWLLWDQVKNPEDRFSHNEAHIILTTFSVWISNILPVIAHTFAYTTDFIDTKGVQSTYFATTLSTYKGNHVQTYIYIIQSLTLFNM